MRVQVKVGSTVAFAKITSDTNSATYNQEMMPIAIGDEVKVIVTDADAFFNDAVGNTTHQLSEDDFRNGSVDLKFRNVESLKLEFKP